MTVVPTEVNTFQDPDASLRDAASLVGRGDMAGAMALAEAAVAAGARHPDLFNLASVAAESRHDYVRATELLERGLALDPDNMVMLVALGMCHVALRSFPSAQAAFDAVLIGDPDFAPAHQGMGALMERTGDFASARRHYERAREILPDYADPIGALAAIAARRGDIAKARELAGEALALNPRQSGGLEALALSLIAEGAFVEAEALLREIVADPSADPLYRARMELALGDALDGQKRYADAFGAYTAGKVAYQRMHATEFEAPGFENYSASVARLRAFFEALASGAWRPQAGETVSPVARHVFLVGFPRSGTTMLETVIARHTGAVALDERPTLLQGAKELLSDDAGLQRLTEVRPDQAEHLRQAYWSSVRSYGLGIDGKVFVDKLPLGTVNLCLINALFPKARILFAVRDPRDVVFSCFRRAFSMNPSTYEFTTLKGTADLYDGVMTLAGIYRSKFQMDFMETRYESLVDDFEGHARSIFAFLGLDWEGAVSDFAATARDREIRTPSARQLAKGLYSGKGQWRPYADELAPVMPVLSRWARHYGYAD